MDVNFEKGIVRLYDKNYKLETVLKRLSLLSGEQVYHFLNNRGIQIPRILNCYALISVLNQKIKFLHSKSLSKDYFTRLQYYKYFTEQQLFNLFRKICNDEVSFQMYRYNFFKLLLLNFVGMNLNDGEITYLKNLKKGNIESFEEYFNYISMVSLEIEGSFDGRSIKELRETLALSASNQDIYDIAGKYGIDLPTRLKKKQFLDFIVYYLKKNNEYSDAMALELEGMTITQLQTYTRRTGVPMQPAMSKNDLVTYLFYYLEQCAMEYTSFSRVVTTPEFEPLDFRIDFSAINAFQNDEATKVVHYAGEENDESTFNQVILKEDIADEEVALDDIEASEPKEEPKEEEKPQVVEADEAKEEASMAIANEAVSLAEEEIAQSVAQEVEAQDTEALEEAKEENDGGFEVSYVDSEYQKEEALEKANEEELNEKETQEDSSLEATNSEAIEEANTPEPSEDGKPIEENEELTDEEIEDIVRAHNESKKNNENDSQKDKFDDVRVNDKYGDERLIKAAKKKSKKGLVITLVLVALLAIGICAYFMLNK